nr:MAG TPA: hypothetical protein [Caudoviricetes sp.]
MVGLNFLRMGQFDSSSFLCILTCILYINNY